MNKEYKVCDSCKKEIRTKKALKETSVPEVFVHNRCYNKWFWVQHHGYVACA